MCPEDDPDHPIIASSATACHCVVLKAVNKARYMISVLSVKFILLLFVSFGKHNEIVCNEAVHQYVQQ